MQGLPSSRTQEENEKGRQNLEPGQADEQPEHEEKSRGARQPQHPNTHKQHNHSHTIT